MNLIMKMLAAPATVLALWAVSAQAATNDDIAKRLEPVGQVCVQGQECKGMEVAVAAGGGGAKTPDEIIAKHTGQPIEKVSADTERDYFLSAEAAREYGIVDRVIESH